jgi:hypothetical protein
MSYVGDSILLYCRLVVNCSLRHATHVPVKMPGGITWRTAHTKEIFTVVYDEVDLPLNAEERKLFIKKKCE